MPPKPPSASNLDVRREAVRAQLAIHGRLSMAQRRALAAQFSCTPAAISADIARLTKAQRAVTTAPAVLTVTSMLDLTDERETALLRALGRLEVLTSAQIHTLFFPDLSGQTMRNRLQRLLHEELIWQTTTTMATIAPPETTRGIRPPPLKAPYIYGLTHTGKAYLESLDVESHEPSFARLKSRDRRAPSIPKQQLTHDLLVSSWCCSVIDAVRRCALLVDIQCQVEYVSAYDAWNKEVQRMDAYLALRFARTPRPQTMPGWWLPWYDGTPQHDDEVTVRFALEVDRGTEKLAILMKKAYIYRTLTASGHYRATLGGPVLPVVLVPPGRRAGQIAVEWQHAWPGGAGIISTPRSANHPIYGALWGQYLILTDNAAKPVHLLGSLVASVESWATMCQKWVPGTPLVS